MSDNSSTRTGVTIKVCFVITVLIILYIDCLMCDCKDGRYFDMCDDDLRGDKVTYDDSLICDVTVSRDDYLTVNLNFIFANTTHLLT